MTTIIVKPISRSYAEITITHEGRGVTIWQGTDTTGATWYRPGELGGGPFTKQGTEKVRVFSDAKTFSEAFAQVITYIEIVKAMRTEGS
jgi:hypothetical protein